MNFLFLVKCLEEPDHLLIRLEYRVNVVWFCFAQTVILILPQCKIKFHGLYLSFLQTIVENKCSQLSVILKAHLKKKQKA